MSSLPGKMNHSFKEGYFDRGVERYYFDKINDNLDILKKTEAPPSTPSPVACRLNNPSFWQELHQFAENNERINHIETIWRQIAPFSHLSLQALWETKTKHLQPLVFQIEALKKELEAERQITMGYFTPAQSFHLKQIEASIGKVGKIRSDIAQFETKFQNSVFARLSLYQLSSNHKLDMPVNTIVDEINKLNIIGKISVSKEQKGVISDDLRTCFYDWLVNANPARKQQFDNIIEPIHQKGFLPVVTNPEIEQSKKHFSTFYEDISNKLLVSSVAKKKHNDKKRFLASRIATWLSNLVLPRPVVKALQVMWYARWIVLQCILASVYFWGSAILLAPIAATIGLPLSIVTNVAFYAIAMFPTWVMTYTAYNWVKDTISDWVIRPKKIQIFDALEALDASERLIRTELSQGILDISHYDIKAHLKKVEDVVKQLSQIKESLKSTWFWQRALFKPELAVGNSVVAKIDETNDRLKGAQAPIAANITKRLPSNLKQLHKNHLNNKIEPLFPENQFKKLALFVKEFANEVTQRSFLANTQLAMGLVKALSKQKCMILSACKSEANAPWGSHGIDKACLTGWQILINGAQQDGPQKQAAQRLIKLLIGEQGMSLPELEEVVSKIAPDDFDNTLKHIQNHVFLCLDNYPYGYATLLSSAQKQIITNWEKENNGLIIVANSFIDKAILSDGPDISLIAKANESELVKYFKAFEGGLIASAAKGNSILGAQNKVKAFLENDDGSNPKTLYLVRFMPKQSKTSVVDSIATKRLNWLIENSKKVTDITDTDIELFYHPALNEKSAKFKANSQIRQHTKFSDRYDASFLSLLNKLKDCGLVSTSLITRYKALHEHETNIKPVTPQFSSKDVPASCRQQTNLKASASQRKRRAGCA